MPVVVSPEERDALMSDAEKGSNARISVDLEAQEIIRPDGTTVSFEIDDFKKHCLLNGLDDIALSLEKEKSISDFEKKNKSQKPWV